jgi:mono/diheme cytochrome c family protein
MAAVATVAARPLTDRRIGRTPQRVERGRYLVEHVAHCFACHSETDWSRGGAGQPKQGLKGAGKTWEDYEGAPFLVSPNITPDPETGAGTWTDDMLARAIREGIGHDGRALFFMPWEYFRTFSDSDVDAVVAYIRTVPPVVKKQPVMQLPEPVRATMLPPEPVTVPVPAPDFEDTLARGRYLAQIGQCGSCHSAYNDAGPIAGLTFGGGLHLKGSWGNVVTPNLTQDPSGISHYDEQVFLTTIREGKLVAKELNTVMPWSYFRGMSDRDLRAIFAYLKTVRRVKHRVDNTTAPTLCRICNVKHGLGELN